MCVCVCVRVGGRRGVNSWVHEGDPPINESVQDRRHVCLPDQLHSCLNNLAAIHAGSHVARQAQQLTAGPVMMLQRGGQWRVVATNVGLRAA